MNPNICNLCGGNYVYRHGRWVCQACGSYKPEELSNEEVTLLYMAYQKLRMAEFREAEKEFEDILQKFPKNPSAYWGHLIAKHRFKYETDNDGKMHPTCYASSIESLLSTHDYKKAMEYADDENQEFYKKQAEYIELIRKEWLERSKRERPYDIFICYKESDKENGIERTKDSEEAQELYNHLTGLGYRVFYSRVSMRERAGEKYESYIFQALATAPVMIVYGSKLEYINSTWLKSEWTRYLTQIADSRKKAGSLIVACDGFAPEELPGALSELQCLDAKGRTFYNDLEKAVDRFVHPGEIISGGSIGGLSRSTDKTSFAWVKPAAIAACSVAVICALLVWLILGIGGSSASLSDSRYGMTVSTIYGSFDKNMMLQVKMLSIDGDWEAKIEGLHLDAEHSRLYNMSLMKDNAEMEWEGDLTVSIPLPEDISEKRLSVYYMGDGKSKKMEYEISGKNIVFTANKLGVYLVATREHTINIDDAVEPTCTTVGYTEGSHCSDCQEVIIAQQTIPALGHTPDGEWQVIKEASKLQNGLRVQDCTVCDEYAKEEILQAHLYVGETITFGSYEQDNDTANGKEDIEWIVLEIKDGKALVISKYALDCQKYNTSYTSVTWENCTLRNWLNNDFLKAAFSEEEQAMIPTVTVSADKNPSYNTNAGNATQDRVYLLSFSEAKTYFGSNSERICEATDYVKAKNTSKMWWLRSVGGYQDNAVYVDANGNVYERGTQVTDVRAAVRPVIWINLNT